tara:strand:+ start:198 stop:851 length:654 start_codon:yes stop_codon:yes gene_type:complete
MPGTPTDVKFNIFKRINTGGLILEPQEIRHALLQGKPSKFVAELAKEESFLEATSYKIKNHRMLDRDFVNRFLSFYLFDHNAYNSDLDSWMTKAMASIYYMPEEVLEKTRDDFTESMKLAKDVFGVEAFRKIYKDHQRLPPINKALFDVIAAQFAKLSNEQRIVILNRKNFMRAELKEMLAGDPYMFDSVTSSTGDRNRVQYRHNQFIKLIFKIVEG